MWQQHFTIRWMQCEKEGKNENMLKNAYIKFMCWFYYKFECMVNNLGENNVPKILYEGTISNYELKILDILAGAGCDILLLQYQGDAPYQKLDAGSKISKELVLENMQPFPEGFSLKNLREDMEKEKRQSEAVWNVTDRTCVYECMDSRRGLRGF